MEDLGGADPSAVILALDLRPSDSVAPITINRIGPAGLEPLAADGLTVDTYTGSGATPNATISVVATDGFMSQIITPDNNTAWFGGQVVSDINGNFTFSMLRPATARQVTIMAQEYMGAARGFYIQEYVTLVRYDFGMYNIAPQAGFIRVEARTTYSTSRGYGWATRVADKYRNDLTMNAMEKDFEYARNATFKVMLPNDIYNVRLYHCNPRNNGSSFFVGKFNVSAEGLFQYTIPSIPAGECDVQTFSVPVVDGIFNLDFNGINDFVISGMDISSGELP